MDDSPLEIIPHGRTLAQHEAIERKKRSGQRGLKLFFVQIAAVFLLILAICLAAK